MNAIELFTTGWENMKEIGHATFWSQSDAVNQEGETTKIFLFYSQNRETALKVEKVLAEAGLLCDTPLGTISSEGVYTKDLPPPPNLKPVDWDGT